MTDVQNFLLGGVLATLVAGATTVAFKITKPEVAQQRGALAEPIDPAILTEHLHNLRGEMALPYRRAKKRPR